MPDDVLPGLEELHRRKLRLAVLTNSDDAIVDALEACGIVGPLIDRRDCFTCVEIGASKPSQRAFAYAARKLGVDLADVLHVGDDRGQCVARRLISSDRAGTMTAPSRRGCKRCTSIETQRRRRALYEGSTSSRTGSMQCDDRHDLIESVRKTVSTKLRMLGRRCEGRLAAM